MTTNATLTLARELYQQGIRRMTVVVRHAAREYDVARPEDEPFLPLTEEGQQAAYEFGLHLPSDAPYRFHSSAVSRCVETAYQIEKGCIKAGASTRVNRVNPNLSPFFILDRTTAITRALTEGIDAYYQNWLRGLVDAATLMAPSDAIQQQLAPVMAFHEHAQPPCINLAITHDCNIYLLKHQCLKHTPEEVAPAEYLEGVIFYENDGELLVSSPTSTPQKLLCIAE